jgi:hypothetical protein
MTLQDFDRAVDEFDRTGVWHLESTANRQTQRSGAGSINIQAAGDIHLGSVARSPVLHREGGYRGSVYASTAIEPKQFS